MSTGLSNIKKYQFDDQLVLSKGISTSIKIQDILHTNIPGAVRVIQASEYSDRNGVDWWVDLANKKRVAIDVKVRTQDWSAKHPGQDDLALEIWSVIEKKKIGWTLDENKKCDYILWFWKDTKRFCLIPFLMLCKVFNENLDLWIQKYRTATQHTPERGYHSECVFVPTSVIWDAILKTYGGSGFLHENSSY